MGNATLLVVLAAAGAAFGLGYFLGTSSQAGTTIEESEMPAVDETVATPKRSSLLSGSDAAPKLEGSTASPAIRSLVESFPVPERDVGNGTITGTVKSNGQPVEGVEITCYPRRDYQAPPETDDPDERLVRMVKYQLETARWRQANEVKVTTGADGSFKLDSLQDSEHQVRAKLDGWRIHARGTHNVKPGTKVEFNATRLSGITLDIYGPDGKEMETAQLSFRSGNSTHGNSWRAKKKLVEMKAGAYELYVTAGKDKEFQAGPLEVEIRADDTPRLRVDLELRPVLVVTLEFPDGEASQGQLYTMPVSGTDAPTAAVLRARGKNQWIHDNNRKRTFTEIKPGRHAVGFARGHNGAFDVIEVADVAAGVTDIVLKIPALDPSRYAVVRVLSPEGKPVSNANFTTGYHTENSTSSGGSQVITRPDGEYYVLNHDRSFTMDDKGGTYWIEVSAGTFGSKRVEYKDSGTRDFSIRFEDPATAEVTVDGVKALGDGQVIQVGLSMGKHSNTMQPCDEKGQARFRALQPGKYTMQVQAGSGHWPATVHSEEVTIRSGNNKLSATLPPLYSVTIRGAEGHVWVQKIEEGKGHRGMHRNGQVADGEAIIDALPAGKYRASSNNRKQAEFHVPGTTVVVLEEQQKK